MLRGKLLVLGLDGLQPVEVVGLVRGLLCLRSGEGGVGVRQPFLLVAKSLCYLRIFGADGLLLAVDRIEDGGVVAELRLHRRRVAVQHGEVAALEQLRGAKVVGDGLLGRREPLYLAVKQVVDLLEGLLVLFVALF